jgi:hypothetical protein
VKLNLRAPEGPTASAPTGRHRDGRVAIPRGFIEDGVLTIAVVYPGPATGTWVSLAGIAVSAVFLGGVALRDRRATGVPRD